MATGTSTKEGDVPTVRDKNGAGRKMPSDGDTGAHGKGPRRSLRGTPNIGNHAKNVDRLTPVATEPKEPKSINEPRDKKDAEANGVIPTASGSVGKSLAEFQDTSGEVDELVYHRVNEDSTVDFKVQWEGSDETSWEPEWSLQEDVPTLVYKYWAGLGGRDIATGLDHYHVFRILQRGEAPKSTKAPKNAQPTDNSKDTQYMYRVQWVGFRPAQSTWERESTLRESAPDAFEEFQAKKSEREAVKSQKRNNARGPGRPPKKARGAKN